MSKIPVLIIHSIGQKSSSSLSNLPASRTYRSSEDNLPLIHRLPRHDFFLTRRCKIKRKSAKYKEKSKNKKQFIMAEDKLSTLPHRNPENPETESISIQHCCSEIQHVNMVSSEALPMEDGRARSLYSPSRSTSAGMC